MVKLFVALCGVAATLASCHQTPATSASPPATPLAADAAPTPGAQTEPAARAAVARYIQALPNAALYVPDSARAVDVATHWQVLVPRTDWAKRLPNKAAFEVDKATGAVTVRPVK